MQQQYDYVILGAGIYGLYAAKFLAPSGCRVAVLEYDAASFQRASYVNQARVHHGYHYPRSYATAVAAAGYFNRFCREFQTAIYNRFKKIYAISAKYSLTNAAQFVQFCRSAGIAAAEIPAARYFQPDQVEAAYETEEYAFDAIKIRDQLLAELAQWPKVQIYYNVRLEHVETKGSCYQIEVNNQRVFSAATVLNATYASINQILKRFGLATYDLKYEICEITLCRVGAELRQVGLTVMDGPFFSVMPFGSGEYHSLSAVRYTPHATSYATLPMFDCQHRNPECSPMQLANCNLCPARPVSAWPYMQQQARKYLRADLRLEFKEALYAIKPIPSASELDDSRPTLIRVYTENPRLISVLSGKINTVYDLEGVLA